MSRNYKLSNWDNSVTRYFKDESNAIWMGQNGIKMNILWPKENQW